MSANFFLGMKMNRIVSPIVIVITAAQGVREGVAIQKWG